MWGAPAVTVKQKTLLGAPASLRPRRWGIPPIAIALYYLCRERF
jgi:hypothetical protein